MSGPGSSFVIANDYGLDGPGSNPGGDDVLSSAHVAGFNTGTTQAQPHQISNTQRTENNTTDVVIQQHSRKLLMMDILMSKTC